MANFVDDAELPDDLANLDFGMASSQTSAQASSEATGDYPSVNADQLLALVNADASKGIFAASQKAPVQVNGGTNAGIQRVNANSGDTGVVGFKDAKGQASFTNQSRDASTGAVIGPTQNAPKLPEGNPASVNTPTSVGTFLNSIRSAKSYAEAQAAYEAFTNASTIELTKIQKQALTFGDNKIGVPALEQRLRETEATDKLSIGYYPGIGDSPVTAKMRAELNAARGIAQHEANNFLSTNVGAKLLQNAVTQAANELKLWERKDAATFAREQQSFARSDAKAEDRLYKEEVAADQITATMLNRARILDPNEFANSTNEKLSAFRITAGRKNNKEYLMAIEAEDAALPILAFMGNAYAKTLVLKSEAFKTGRSEDAVKADMDKVVKLSISPTLPAQWATVQKMDPNQSKAMLSELKQLELSPDKKDAVSQRKVMMALDVVAATKTQKFLTDLTSWDSIDISLRTAIAQSQKVSGNASFDNVLTAFVGDKTGVEAQQKLKEFQGLMLSAADKHKESVFRMPDYNQGNAILNNWTIRSGIFSKLMLQKLPNPLNSTEEAAMFGPFGLSLKGLYDAGNALETLVPTKNVKATDPTTGRPFGE